MKKTLVESLWVEAEKVGGQVFAFRDTAQTIATGSKRGNQKSKV